jgi:archaemetzincin
VRIRARILPNGIYKGQVNLDDLLDAAISLLPKDAYALLMLVDFDLYEDEDDEFVCGLHTGEVGLQLCLVRDTTPLWTIFKGLNVSMHGLRRIARGIMSACSATESAPKKQKRIPIKSRGSQKSVRDLALDGPLKDAVSVYRSLPEVGTSTPLMSALCSLSKQHMLTDEDQDEIMRTEIKPDRNMYLVRIAKSRIGGRWSSADPKI